MNIQEQRKTITIGYKNITLILNSRKGLKLLWCVRETD